MKHKTIADHMIDIMNEKDINYIWAGELDAIHECADRANIKKHPLQVINSVLNALDRSDKFKKQYLRANAMTGNTDKICKYRLFSLKEKEE
ncbi:MAG: hypothetical protein J1E41_01635 [Ruminococcus sp.]|nr:hypothetical protein [Ruminococcus sp.]